MKVPLWMAIYLYQRKQCRIQLPDWLNAEHLQGAHAFTIPAGDCSTLATPCNATRLNPNDTTPGGAKTMDHH